MSPLDAWAWWLVQIDRGFINHPDVVAAHPALFRAAPEWPA